VIEHVVETSSSFQGKVIAITGASGTMGRALAEELARQGAKIIALTTSSNAEFDSSIEVLSWKPGAELELSDRLRSINILIINHGINVHGDRTLEAIEKSFEVNTFSAWKLAECFLSTASAAPQATKELWINTSEAEVSLALSPLYELSKRTLGDLITLRRLDTPCTIRKLILGPFKSQLNPAGVMSPRWVAGAIVTLAKLNFQDIIVSINPITYLTFPLKEFFHSLYFRLFSHGVDR
jgi:monoglucosyldiacylglycerol epimerase